ncbi:cytochrome b/b6 domain-containing protein [Mangrovibacterium diazotrophicum]|uniref:Thiosulfate reductase cytochrome b subunit n=1 Tax=Mangrovibacterium diazotrophicum TaxID=1261403 RepID=A0A419VYX7_9BACT|nr:cytochrome b/b6 domain-containing protein [Mangrovibacterium diazotrophicum]RKD88432.1 thiosulfate reductase cytochrome b subunit [Mangrovibacterium diazotrophicum]
MTANKIYYYPVWLRIWHGINAIGILLLILTGISMNAGVDSKFLISFDKAIDIHNVAGIVVTINYLVYFILNMATPNGKFYIVKPKSFLKRPMKQAYYYAWGMFHGMKAPYPLSEKRKFNPLQKYTYIIVMYAVMPCVIISGFGLLFPEIIIEKVYNVSGIFLTAVFHSALGFFISIFLIIHLYIASIGKSPLDNFKSIVTGWHHTS